MDAENRLGALPRNWECAFGYDGEARHVAFYWTPAGDEAMYYDGRVSGDGNWGLFLGLRHAHPELDERYNVGYSDLEADDWLVLDRETRDLVVVPMAEARARLRAQWPPIDLRAELNALDWQTIQQAVREAMTLTDAALAHARPCEVCCRTIAPGWLPAADGGFDRCPACNGWGFRPGPDASSAVVTLATALPTAQLS